MTVWAVFSLDLRDNENEEVLVHLYETEVSANAFIDETEDEYPHHDFYYRELQVFK